MVALSKEYVQAKANARVEIGALILENVDTFIRLAEVTGDTDTLEKLQWAKRYQEWPIYWEPGMGIKEDNLQQIVDHYSVVPGEELAVAEA